jgi:hypothetical protein
MRATKVSFIRIVNGIFEKFSGLARSPGAVLTSRVPYQQTHTIHSHAPWRNMCISSSSLTPEFYKVLEAMKVYVHYSSLLHPWYLTLPVLNHSHRPTPPLETLKHIRRCPVITKHCSASDTDEPRLKRSQRQSGPSGIARQPR